MKINSQSKPRSSGFVLLLVLLLSAFSLIILAGMMNRTSTVSLLNQRNTQLSVMDSAAEAAVEKVYARMASEFIANGPGFVTNQVRDGVYQSMVPNTSDNTYWGAFTFSDPATGTASRVYVSYLTNYNGSLPTQYTNQFAYNSPIYRIACNATAPNATVNVTGTAMEDVLLALVPITTYAIFYNGELEFSDCATMTVNGRVHSNANICVGAGSGASLTFNSLVTCCQTVLAPKRGNISIWTVNDPTTWATTFNAADKYTTNYSKITVAMTMTNTHSIIDIPPAGEDVRSQQGMVRLYNQAQVILVVTNPTGATIPTVMLTLQTAANQNLPVTDTSKQNYTVAGATEGYLNTNQIVQLPFLTLTNTIPDLRQKQTSQYITDIDIKAYDDWLQTNVVAKGKFNLTNGPFPTILYVADRRNLGTTKQAAVRLSNAAKLPTNKGLGFTVATQNPIYIKGNYNTTINSNTWATALGSTTNGASVPAAILADAVTLLSAGWSDTSYAYSSRPKVASTMTFNAALVTGAMPSTGTDAHTFSGGVHNLTRFLEDWQQNNIHLVLNTSIVNLFNSQIATNQFIMPYSSSETDGYYNAPTRDWGFDQTYYSPDKQPPGIPCALVPVRFNWCKPSPGSVVSN